MDYSTRKLAKQGVYQLRVSFDLENGPIFPLGAIGSIAKITKISLDYSTQKLKKRGVYPIWGSFDSDNWLVYISRQTDSISKTSKKNFSKNDVKNLDDQKIVGLAHKNLQNGGFTFSWDRLNLKMGRFSHRDQPVPKLWSSQTSMKDFGKNDVGNLDHQKIHGL
ncbi:hypothetical protein H5410_056456 [Solanum commersonii]|uniref:Uncharacterized protein n=1 Tax=Solanum commersonii TaxID=4109 RepID=A0A9J5WLC6_SOLCO|nr:hypothetical protein H5410_056456 [Solanum commersonii]